MVTWLSQRKCVDQICDNIVMEHARASQVKTRAEQTKARYYKYIIGEITMAAKKKAAKKTTTKKVAKKATKKVAKKKKK